MRQGRRLTERLRNAWAESGQVCGYRELHNDLVEQSESSGPNGMLSPAGFKRQQVMIRESARETRGG